jgi:hypothetical protein
MPVRGLVRRIDRSYGRLVRDLSRALPEFSLLFSGPRGYVFHVPPRYRSNNARPHREDFVYYVWGLPPPFRPSLFAGTITRRSRSTGPVKSTGAPRVVKMPMLIARSSR